MTENTISAFEHLPLAAAIVDVTEVRVPTVVAANRAMLALTGYSSEKLVGMPLNHLTPTVNDRTGLFTGKNKPRTWEAQCVAADGRKIAVIIHASVLPGEGHLPTAIVQIQVQGHQPDAERALRTSEKRLQDMADNVTALIYLKRTDGRYVFINHHYEQLLGLQREEVQGKTDFDLWPPEIATAYTAADRAVLQAGAPMEFEEPIPTEEGTWGMWLSLKFPLFDEDGITYGVGGISTDISDRNRAEAAIREAKDEAERANRAKSEFLSRMSHELRTPLNSILGFGQLLQLEELPLSAAEGVDRIVSAGRHLLSLINEVLEISRIEAGVQAMSVEPVHACDPLNEAFELVQPLAADRGIELVRDLHGALFQFVLADYQRLKQVLLNILMNAVKYNRPDGVVSVTVEVLGDRLRYRITDTGMGMDAVDVEKIFRPFERLDADKTDAEGTGLGLALSKSLVESMGGSVGVERTVKGRGSVFFVELPTTESVKREPDLLFQQVNDATLAHADLSSMTILYIEDNLANLELVRRVLARAGEPAIMPAMQGQLGIELAALHSPDLILLDLHLPDIDGEEVLRRLRDDERTRGIPVVILSADATPMQIDRLKAGGAADYVTKPLDIAAFLEAVRRGVERRVE